MSQMEMTSSNARKAVNFYSWGEYKSPPVFMLTKPEVVVDIYTLIEDDVTDEEKAQVEKSRHDISAGKAKRYGNAEEYLKSLDEEPE